MRMTSATHTFIASPYLGSRQVGTATLRCVGWRAARIASAQLGISHATPVKGSVPSSKLIGDPSSGGPEARQDRHTKFVTHAVGDARSRALGNDDRVDR